MGVLEPAAGGPAASASGARIEIKPRLRGWLHAYAAAVSVGTGVALVAVAAVLRGDTAVASTTVYAVTVTLLFGTSALYHRRSWGPRGRAVMKRLDHSMIFVFIAGTYTPIAVFTLARTEAIAVLIVVWSGAAFGAALQTGWPNAPRWLSVACYIALGWAAVFLCPQLIRDLGVTPFALLAGGGLVYTLGAIVYGRKRPDPWPGTFGFHEVFHACTLVAALCHYIAIWLAVFG